MTDGCCYECGATRQELDDVGRTLYLCDAPGCTNECCSDDSENGPNDVVWCDQCWENGDAEVSA